LIDPVARAPAASAAAPAAAAAADRPACPPRSQDVLLARQICRSTMRSSSLRSLLCARSKSNGMLTRVVGGALRTVGDRALDVDRSPRRVMIDNGCRMLLPRCHCSTPAAAAAAAAPAVLVDRVACARSGSRGRPPRAWDTCTAGPRFAFSPAAPPPGRASPPAPSPLPAPHCVAGGPGRLPCRLPYRLHGDGLDNYLFLLSTTKYTTTTLLLLYYYCYITTTTTYYYYYYTTISSPLPFYYMLLIYYILYSQASRRVDHRGGPCGGGGGGARSAFLRWARRAGRAAGEKGAAAGATGARPRTPTSRVQNARGGAGRPGQHGTLGQGGLLPSGRQSIGTCSCPWRRPSSRLKPARSSGEC
jgi:hypothetical protein